MSLIAFFIKSKETMRESRNVCLDFQHIVVMYKSIDELFVHCKNSLLEKVYFKSILYPWNLSSVRIKNIAVKISLS